MFLVIIEEVTEDLKVGGIHARILKKESRRQRKSWGYAVVIRKWEEKPEKAGKESPHLFSNILE